MDPESLRVMQQQVAQAMIEHQIVERQMILSLAVSAGFVVVLGLLSFYHARRSNYLSEALILQTKRHSAEQRTMLERHSLELSSTMMQLLHGFEAIAGRRRGG